MSVDIIFINMLAFLVSMSKRLKFTKIEYIPNELKKELAMSVNNLLDVYKNEASQSILCIWTPSLTV